MRNYIKKVFQSLTAALLIIGFGLLPLNVLALTWTVGNTANGGNTLTNSADRIRVSAGTAPVNGYLKVGKARLSVDATASTNTKMVVFDSDGTSGAPGTRLAVSDEVNISNSSEAEISFTFSDPNQIYMTVGHIYWIGVAFQDPGALDWKYSNTTAVGQVIYNSSDTYADGVEATFNSTGTTADRQIDAFVEIDEQLGSSYPIINPNLYDSGMRLDFDGVDERLTSASNPSYSSDTKSGGRTICMWFNLDTLPASETARILFSWSNSDAQGVWNFRIRTDRAVHGWSGTRWELQTALDTGAGTGTSTFVYSSAQTFAATTNYHLCLVSSGTAWSLYVNGSSTTVTVGAAGSGGNDGDWWGDVNGSGTITFFIWGVTTDGKGDDFAYFDDDLTAAEILRLYNGGKPIHPLAVGLTDLSGYWKMGEDSDGNVTTLYDAQGDDDYSSINMENADILRTNYY